MSNLTLVVEEELLLRARKRALAQGTSVNALVRAYLQGYAGRDPARQQAAASLLQGLVARRVVPVTSTHVLQEVCAALTGRLGPGGAGGAGGAADDGGRRLRHRERGRAAGVAGGDPVLR